MTNSKKRPSRDRLFQLLDRGTPMSRAAQLAGFKRNPKMLVYLRSKYTQHLYACGR
jgi:hypothetical protein